MILNRVLPSIHFTKFSRVEKEQQKLEEEVVTMLKASICILGVEINTIETCAKNLGSHMTMNSSINIFGNLGTGGYEGEGSEGSINLIVDQLNKDTRDNSDYTAQLNLGNSDDCSQIDLKNNLFRQHGKSDLFAEKVYDCRLKQAYNKNNSLILANGMEKEESSLLKQQKEGFKVLTPAEKATIFDNKRDDLFYKTFGRDVRKFLQDDFTNFTNYRKDSKGKDGKYFYECLVSYAERMNFHQNTDVTLGNIVGYLGSLINHREFKKAGPAEYADLSYQVYNTFNLFTKERLFNLGGSEEFKLLFRYYVQEVGQESRFNRLKNHKTIGANLAPYLFMYNEFGRVCLL